jgi:phage portal protein BeeE
MRQPRDFDWTQVGLSPQERDFLDSRRWATRIMRTAFGMLPNATTTLHQLGQSREKRI